MHCCLVMPKTGVSSLLIGPTHLLLGLTETVVVMAGHDPTQADEVEVLVSLQGSRVVVTVTLLDGVLTVFVSVLGIPWLREVVAEGGNCPQGTWICPPEATEVLVQTTVVFVVYSLT